MELVAQVDSTNAASSQYDAASDALVAQIAALPTQAASLSFESATYRTELESLRSAANRAGFSLLRLRSIPVQDDGTKVTAAFKLGPKIVANRKPKADAAPVVEDAKPAK